MPHFPMFVDLSGQRVLVIGGGKVALRKIQKLLPFGASLTVIAPEILPQIEAIPGLTLRRRPWKPRDLYPRPAMVIAAANDKKVNHEVSELCRKRHIPVNAVDDTEDCSFLFPALVQKGHFTAGISTGGASPTAASFYRQELEALVPDNIDEILVFLEAQRTRLKEEFSDPAQRAAALRDLFYDCLGYGTEKSGDGCGSVALVGAGCGKADLITVRGLRILQRCQAVVYDDLIDPALLEAAPESARRIYMGKRRGAHSASQEEINDTLIALARSGLRVVRLKGGDSYLFGRGGEEMLALKAAGIPCQEVPGIPSPIGIPAEAGIPVTHRGLSRELHIVTGHTADTPDGLPADLDTLAALDGTLVVLMGLNQLPRIAERLLAAGKAPDTPAAVISGGNSPNPCTVRAPLSNLPQAAREAGVHAPAIILVGEVAALELGM